MKTCGAIPLATLVGAYGRAVALAVVAGRDNRVAASREARPSGRPQRVAIGDMREELF